jgi:hypothetical protein
VVSGGFSVLGSVVAALVVPVLSIYLLNDFDRITKAIRGHLPRRYRRIVTEYAHEIDAALSHFVRGQLTVMAIMAVLYGTAYSIWACGCGRRVPPREGQRVPAPQGRPRTQELQTDRRSSGWCASAGALIFAAVRGEAA